MLYNLERLRWQNDWRGTQLQNLRILVCTNTCLDIPQRQLGTIILPPDPMPLLNARPEQYQLDEYWSWQWEGAGVPIYMENSEAPITMEYSIYSNDGDWPWPP